jgi:glycosyltransferase involved in cell wall biosynthesis
MGVSILILTRDEEANLPGCLAAVAWSDDVVVLDSLSTDGTAAIAEAAGARVVRRAFDNWSAHQNWAMENIRFKHPWVFYLDADERMTDGLRAEVEAIAADGGRPEVAYFCGRTNYFMGRWIKHCYPPSWLMRFFRPERVRFERLVNPMPVIDGPYGYLAGRFTHYNFSKGFAEWFDKHNKYSSMEALEGIKLASAARDGASVFSRDGATRRRAIKHLSFRLPFRPLSKFLYLYLWRLGFLDGRPGLTYCVLQSIYEYQIALKIREIRLRERGRTL